MNRSSMKIDIALIFLCVPSAIGYITGWLAGASRSPVTATVLPLVFGLIGVAGFGNLGRFLVGKNVLERILGSLAKEKLGKEVQEQIEQRAKENATVPVQTAVAILVFSAFFFIGLKSGISIRIPNYPAFKDTFKNLPLRPYEHAALFRLRLALQSSGVQPTDYEALMTGSFAPVFQKYPVKEPAVGFVDERHAVFFEVLNTVSPNLINDYSSAPSPAPAAPSDDGPPDVAPTPKV